jgi:hypothetical protein
MISTSMNTFQLEIFFVGYLVSNLTFMGKTMVLLVLNGRIGV